MNNNSINFNLANNDNFNNNLLNLKILFLLYEIKIKPSILYEEYKQNNFNLQKTVDYFFLKYDIKNQKKLFEDSSNSINNNYDNYNNYINKINKNEIKIVNISQNYYPYLLKQINNPPIILFYKGDKIKKSKYFISIVGTRKNTVYGRDVAKYFAEELSKMGITVVSGLASGIDYYAHNSALKYKGGTIGILGCGLDIIYPESNKELYKNILNNGSLVSEFPPGTKPLKNNFPIRNRIVSGFSMGTIVIEAPEKSGALITAEFALNQNREVFCVPGNIFSNESKGCHNLIKQGAKLVSNIDDIIEEINQFFNKDFDLKQNNLNYKKVKHTFFKKESLKLNNEQKIIYEIIGFKPKSIEEVVMETKFDVTKVLQIISELQLKKLIFEKNLNHFIRL